MNRGESWAGLSDVLRFSFYCLPSSLSLNHIEPAVIKSTTNQQTSLAQDIYLFLGPDFVIAESLDLNWEAAIIAVALCFWTELAQGRDT